VYRRTRGAKLLAAALIHSISQEMNTLVTVLESGYWSVPPIPRSGLLQGRRASAQNVDNRKVTRTHLQQSALTTDTGVMGASNRRSLEEYSPADIDDFIHRRMETSTMSCTSRSSEWPWPGWSNQGLQPLPQVMGDSLLVSKDEQLVQSGRPPSSWFLELKSSVYPARGSSNLGSSTAPAILEDSETYTAPVHQPEAMTSSQWNAGRVAPSAGHFLDSKLCPFKGAQRTRPDAAISSMGNPFLHRDQVGLL
jgi:hypothetical protein